VRRDRLELVAAKAALEFVPPEDLRDAAVAALEDGLDSPALRALAGLSSAEIDEARLLFERALAELKVPMPSPRDAVTRVAREIAAKVVDGTVAPYQGAKRIWELTLRAPEEELSELDSFVYAASEWEDRPEDRSLFDDGIVRAAQELLER
jgi:hypothetical protein